MQNMELLDDMVNKHAKNQISTATDTKCNTTMTGKRNPRKENKPMSRKGSDSGGIKKPLIFRLHVNVPSVVREVLLERGWIEFDEHEQDNEDWNLYWQTYPIQMTDYWSIKPWQRLNHYPETIRITRKDYLARHLNRMKGVYGSTLYEFSPPSFVMPNDYIKFITEYTKERQMPGKKLSYWISKPVNKSRGKGILIFQDIKDFVYDCMVVVQKYISNPLTVSGYKCDLRIYVCVTSFCPLTIYIYEEGLVRFATERYDLSSLDNVYAHLTNTSINKFGPSYEKNKDVIGSGCKWNFGRFRTYLRSRNIDDQRLWQKINHIVTLTLLAITPSVPFTSNCFELFGFDVLVDDKLKPWLLEVNHSPGLCLDCAIDSEVKRELLHDVIDLLNYKEFDPLRRHKEVVRRTSCFGRTQSLLNTTRSEDSLNLLTCRRECKSASASPSPSLMQIPKEASEFDRRGSAYPKKTKTSQMRERLNMPKKPLQSKPSVKNKLLKSSSSLCEPVQSTVWLSRNGLYADLPSIPLYCLSDRDRRPFPRVGNFVLIFPFNEVALKASRNEIDVKGIIQEIHKVMSRELKPE